MTRGINATTATALATDAFEFATLIQMDFGTVVRITNWPANVTAFSNTFVSSADILDMSAPSETGDLRVNEFTLTLSGVSLTWINLFLAGDYVNVRTQVWQAVLSSGVVVGDPIQVFDGNITNYDVEETDTTSQVMVTIASHWKDFDRVNGRKTNPASQKKYFPDDEGMQYAKELIRDIPWGRK